MRVHNVFSKKLGLGLMHVVLVLAGIVLVPEWTPAQAERKEAPAGTSFESFEIVVNRNIFDPNRQADKRTPTPEEMAAAADTNKGASSEQEIDHFQGNEVALVGTLIDGPTAVAFFTSETSDFKTIAQVGEQVGDFKLAQIRTEYVRLENKGKTIDLPVGSRMTSQKDGGWSMGQNPRPVRAHGEGEASEGDSSRRDGPGRERESGRRDEVTKGSDPARPAREEKAGSPPEEESGAPKAASSGTEDVLKKLMERRRKALEK